MPTIYEVLHIDISGSRDFFSRIGATTFEQTQCLALARDAISESCQRYEGRLAKNWQGDGGYALFKIGASAGNSTLAARDFLENIPRLREQTLSTLGRKVEFKNVDWKFRLKSHVCELVVTDDDTVTSGPTFGDFIKGEKEFSPRPNEIFITDQLHKMIGGSLREQFKEHSSSDIVFGELRTRLWRMAPPQPNLIPVFNRVGSNEEPRPSEWNHLVETTNAMAINSVALNTIPVELMHALREQGHNGVVEPKAIRGAVLAALSGYLEAVYGPHQFQLRIWSKFMKDDTVWLVPAGRLPEIEEKDEPVKASEVDYHLCRAFARSRTVVCESITTARIKGDWKDYPNRKTLEELGYHSAIRLPIFWPQKKAGNMTFPETLGVLGIDADQNDFFTIGKLVKWNQELVGYLAWLALASNIEYVWESGLMK